MGGLKSLDKGKRAEREVVQLLQKKISEVYAGAETPYLQRNTLQSDKGGYDIVGLGWMGVEVKHQEQFAVDRWWEQCVKQAQQKSVAPILFFRKNRVSWKVMLQVKVSNVIIPVEITLEIFLILFAKELRQRMVAKDKPTFIF